MAITYSWKVTGLRTRNEGSYTDAVVQTYWQKIGTDENGIQGIFSGATPFTAENVPEGEFINFENLTEEIVLNWIISSIPQRFDEHMNERIQEFIDLKINPIVDRELPWATEQ